MTKVKLKTRLRDYQIKELKFHLSKDRSGSWDEMGVGKTLISLAKLSVLYNRGDIRFILIVCPLSVIYTWASEIKKHTTFEYTILKGSLEQKVKLLANATPIFLISYDSIPGRKRTLGILLNILLKKKFNFIVLDEVTHIKSHTALRTKAVTKLCNTIGKTLCLSGTPITNSPESVLTIYNALDGGQTFGRNYFAARNHFFENRGFNFPDWKLRDDRKEEFKQRLFFNCTRLLKTECLDLPEKIYTERYSQLDGVQRSVYRGIAEELLKELILPVGTVKIQNSLVKIAKLSQLTSGFLYTDKDTQLFPSNPKRDLLLLTLEELPIEEKVIVFCRWRQDINFIRELFDNQGISYALLDGNTKDSQIPIYKFTNDSTVKILLSQITVGSYSFTLTVAHTIIYYSFGFSFIEWAQSQDRIHRFGQTKTCVYIPLLLKDSIDEYIYLTLKENTDIAKSLLDERSRIRLKENLNLCI